ncbi:hypothetical protein SAMN04487968_11117 [Nocardioides terrae]|uniref:Monooxygenase n=1 Tax=Nocardioides terrae TaxID=574651 RepID=A0A1I1LVP8_9ACTN|nr:DUF5990 family protein [Nocardioides terrae]SFC76552.1 hypothetical protein SAMN04487968_11117 [Nocardioides terrae]
MLLEIRGHNLPGRTWHLDDGPCHNVHVGLQVGRDAVDLVPGDSDAAHWRAEIEVLERDGGTDFCGPAVHGRPGARFVYLTWGAVEATGAFTMFRRAKLMLEDVAPLVTGRSTEHVVATVDLTDERGGPRCARLRPPALTLRSA